MTSLLCTSPRGWSESRGPFIQQLASRSGPALPWRPRDVPRRLANDDCGRSDTEGVRDTSGAWKQLCMCVTVVLVQMCDLFHLLW